MSIEEQKELFGLLHELWSKDVGTTDYDKNKWKRFGELIEKKGLRMDLVSYQTTPVRQSTAQELSEQLVAILKQNGITKGTFRFSGDGFSVTAHIK